jgi:hypothetical protein
MRGKLTPTQLVLIGDPMSCKIPFVTPQFRIRKEKNWRRKRNERRKERKKIRNR